MARRFGIGEWYGRRLMATTLAERSELNRLRLGGEPIPCPFKSHLPSFQQACRKKGGVCSLRSYVAGPNGEAVLDDVNSQLRITCPTRFEDGLMVSRWIGEVILQTSDPIVVGEVGFLESTTLPGQKVGRIDRILVHPNLDPFRWCAVEIQGVYFSGTRMDDEYEHIADPRNTQLPFPLAGRRPDYRSSGPKRLMPQLQLKIPTLRRWARKMAVVVDEAFFNSFQLKTVPDLGNADIAWFVVGLDESGGRANLVRRSVHFTELEEAVQGLMAGTALTQSAFEAQVREKMQRRSHGLGSLELGEPGETFSD